jgi:hypothetical protein
MKHLRHFNEHLNNELQEIAEFFYYAFEDHNYYEFKPLNKGYTDTVYYNGVVEVRDMSSGQYEVYMNLGIPEPYSGPSLFGGSSTMKYSNDAELNKLNVEVKKIARKLGFSEKSHVDYICSYLDETDNMIKASIVIYK